jgi:uncharacterized surface protein with fasciclin (FAS1) repeats
VIPEHEQGWPWIGDMRPPMPDYVPIAIKTSVTKEVTWTPAPAWFNEESPPSPPRIITKAYDVSPSGSGTSSPPEKEFNNLIFGVIFLILVIICPMLMSITSTLYAQDSLQGISTTNQISASAPLTVFPTPDIPKTGSITGSMIHLIPTTVPPGNSAAALPDAPFGVSTAGRPPGSEMISAYVTIEPKPSLDIARHVSLQPSVTQKYGEGFVTIYSLIGQNVSQVLPLVSFSLQNPPLVIDYNVTPQNLVDIKHVEYKMVDTYYEENLEINRPYEDSWFEIIVRNKDTGEVVSEDGIGRTYSFQTPKQLVIRENGNYSFEFTGGYGALDLIMKVRQEGNFPPATQFERTDVQVTLPPIPSVMTGVPSPQPTQAPTPIPPMTTVVPSPHAGMQNIEETLASDGRFTTLVTAVNAAGLDDTLRSNTLSGSEQFTVFAPTDDAFRKLSAGSMDSLLREPQGDLLQILLYHVIQGNVSAADLRKLTSVETLQGGSLPISVSNGVITAGGAQVIFTDRACTNGVIHEVDTVMLPPA